MDKIPTVSSDPKQLNMLLLIDGGNSNSKAILSKKIPTESELRERISE